MRSIAFRMGGLTLLSATIMTAGAAAQDIVIADGETVTTPLLLGNAGDTLTVEPGGAIDVSGFGLDAVEGTASDQSFVNNGTITLNNDSSSDGSGIRSKGDNAVIVNGGRIDAQNIAIGIRSDGDAAAITNSGTIDADSYGIRSTGSNAVITNTGTITALDHGIRSDGDHAIVVNRGTVLGSPQGTVVDIHGIRSGGDFAMITNYGTARGDADGLFSIGDNATIVNYGTLVGGTAGLGSQGDDSTIINYGTIMTDGGPRAIGIVGVNSELVLMPGSVVEGLVRFDGINEKLTLPTGQSQYLDYGGEFTTLDSTAPFVLDTTNTLVVTVDPTAFAAPGIWLQTLTGAIHQGIGGNDGADGSGSTFAFGEPTINPDGSGRQIWAGGFGGFQSQSGSGALTDMDQGYGGAIAGAGIVSGARMYGAFAGGSYSRFETDNASQTVDSTSAFGGLYGAGTHGAVRIKGTLMGGYARFSSDRRVANNTVTGGVETATADYDGYFLSPSLTATREIGDRASISLGGYYAALFLDSYEESGSAAGLAVDSRTVQVAALRAEAAFRAAEWNGQTGTTSVHTWFGIDGQFNLGGDTVNGTVTGLPIDFSTSYADAAAIGFIGAGLKRTSDDGGWFFDASVEGRYGTDSFWEVRASGLAGRRF